MNDRSNIYFKNQFPLGKVKKTFQVHGNMSKVLHMNKLVQNKICRVRFESGY